MRRELTGTATRTVAVSAPECFGLLADVERYREWYPDAVREVDVLERDPAGQPQRARVKLHLAWGPVVKDFDLVLGVELEAPRQVRLARIREPSSTGTFEVTWRLGPGSGTEIALELRATLDVPRFLPLGGIGDAIAGGFVQAAARRLEGAAGS